ncbi:MAG: DUF3300 domain-containing protein [Betaproteobacteria bacterium]|nr:DUF3300 domain-containing protein [Betaproteobacteria bacterium]
MKAWFFSASRAGCLSMLAVMAMGLVSIVPPALARNTYPSATYPPPNSPDTPPTSVDSTITQETLDGLLAPIALYPDALLAQVLMAATFPVDVIEAAHWQKENPGLSGQALQNVLAGFDWDPSVKSLMTVPQVLQYMSSSPRWMQSLGRAMVDNQEWVMSTVQELRQRAQTAGTLTSNDKQTVGVDENATDESKYITITPTSPNVVYVPVYDPYIVYGSWWWPTRPIYWRPPTGAYLTSGFYWSSYYYPSIALWGGFNWGLGAIVINVPLYRSYYRTMPPMRGYRGYNVWRPSLGYTVVGRYRPQFSAPRPYGGGGYHQRGGGGRFPRGGGRP